MLHAMRLLLGRSNQGPVIDVPDGLYTHYVVDPANAYVALQFNPDGTVTTSSGADPAFAPNWRTGGGAGADYDISFNGGSAWLNLGTARLMSTSRSFPGTTSNTFDVRIRPAGGGGNLATGSITLVAEVEGSA